MSMEGIYISREQLKAIEEMAKQARIEAEAVRAARHRDLDAYYIHQASREPVQPGGVLDIREHLKKRYL